MYDDFEVADPWSGESLRCKWRANIVALATRHADAVDVCYEINGRPVSIALPSAAWIEQKRRTGHVITDRLAAQLAGHYLKSAIESGYDNGRAIYTMTIEEVLDHAGHVMSEVRHSSLLPELPVVPS